MTLRDYQTDIATKAVDILREHGIVYLAMQVRTGKTITALHTADIMGAQRVLFVTRKKAISSILSDAEAIGIDYSLDVINYEQLHNVTEDYDLVIADEAHGLGAYPRPSERAEQLRRIVGSNPIILLSGTPTPESYAQLYHQLWVSTRSPWVKYRNFYAWAKDFVTVTDRRFGHATVKDYSNADRNLVEADTQHLFLTYTQEEAGFDAPVEEEVLTVKMSPSTYALAAALMMKRIVTNSDGHSVLADTEVKLMQKLHQIYSGSVIIDEPARNASAFDMTKAQFIRNKFAGRKIAIFYKFIAEGVMLKAHFNWTESPDEFNASTDKVFISQVQSGREGINLSTADALIMYNIDFSAVSYWQARARLQTRDRTAPAKVYWIFAENGIEHKIYKAVNNKKDYTLAYFKRDYAGITDPVPNHPQAAR